MAPKRGPTAYFLFADTARAEVRAELVAAASAGADPTASAPKISVAAVAKGVGERWKALTEAEREAWKEKAASKAAEAAAAREAGEATEEEEEEAAPKAAAAAPSSSAQAPSFPLSIVRKLIMLDPEVGRVSADAAKAISAAAAAFAASTLAGSAATVAAQAKRRTLRASDVTRAASRDTRCLDMGLLPVLNAVSGGALSASAPAAAAKENAKPRASAPSSAGSKRGPVPVGGGTAEDVNKKRKGKGVASAQKPVRPAAAFFAPYKGKAAAM